MTATSASAPPKLAVWHTVHPSHAAALASPGVAVHAGQHAAPRHGATALCMLPAVGLAILVALLMLFVRAPWWLGFSWPQSVALQWASMPVWDLAIQLSLSFAYAVFVTIGLIWKI